MTRRFKRPDYEGALQTSIQLGEALPMNQLARCIVDGVAQLDISSIDAGYAPVGGEAIAPEILLGLLFYGYASGVISSRKIEGGTYESIRLRFIASGQPPDQDTMANFRKTFLAEIQDWFVPVWLLAKTAGVLKVGNIRLDGPKIHADASKSKAVSYKRLGELEAQLRHEVQELMRLGEAADQGDRVLPEGRVIVDEITLRQERLENLAKARTVLDARAQDRYAAEQAEYDAKVQRRQAPTRHAKRKPGGRSPKAPQPGPRDKDHYTFSDPHWRILKNSTDKGVDQHYNAQIAVTQDPLFIVGHALSNHPNDQKEMTPPLEAIFPSVGQVKAAAVDNGYFSEANMAACLERHIEPSSATGREPHHLSWQTFVAHQATPPADDASPKVKIADKLQTEIGQALYRLRKCTVEPLIGILKEVLGFRQFSLRGLDAVPGEWGLVCWAFDLKRWHSLSIA